ncbi:hypothetical protein INR49_027762 [Caranx melampygus]|nr:hypothetical protein INR49_027762 [Caranx melampygus]
MLLLLMLMLSSDHPGRFDCRNPLSLYPRLRFLRWMLRANGKGNPSMCIKVAFRKKKERKKAIRAELGSGFPRNASPPPVDFRHLQLSTTSASGGEQRSRVDRRLLSLRDLELQAPWIKT